MAVETTPYLILQSAFPGIRRSEVGEMLKAGKIHTFPSGVVLCHEGAIEEQFYIILEGEVEVTKLLNQDEIRVMKHLKPGDFFGEMALIHNAPRAATVTTLTQTTTVLEIDKVAFHRLLERYSSVSRAMVSEVSRRLRENDEMAIEDLRTKANELAEAYEQLASQEYARRLFLTTIAHELRTPLTAAGGFLRVIRMGMLQGEALNSALDTVARNIQDIISLVNDILFLQEMDLILPAFQPIEIGAVVAAAVEAQRGRAQQNRVGMQLTITPNLPRIHGDPKSLERAISAILDNAIKFSPEGGNIAIEVCALAEDVLVKVADSGVGIPAEAIPHIFERFFHLDEVGGHTFRGVGLGLSIVKQVIEQHGGDIRVHSELGRGSTFTISLAAHPINDDI